MLLLVILDGFCPNDDKFATPHVEAAHTNRSPSSKRVRVAITRFSLLTVVLRWRIAFGVFVGFPHIDNHGQSPCPEEFLRADFFDPVPRSLGEPCKCGDTVVHGCGHILCFE
jgi:hypothetical protein